MSAWCLGSGRVLVYPNRCPSCGRDFSGKVRIGRSGTPRHKSAPASAVSGEPTDPEVTT